jgi:hypothetical protein
MFYDEALKEMQAARERANSELALGLSVEIRNLLLPEPV